MRRSVRTSDGTYLAVVEFGGAGTPILLLHGLMGRATTWWSLARRLTAYGRVVALDARGHGRSQAAGPWTVDRMAQDAAEILEPLGPGVVVGHSMGGLHALVLAATRPELVRGLVVEDMSCDLTGVSPRWMGDMTAWFGAIPQPFPSLAAVREAFGHPRPEFGDYMAECCEERADGFHLLTRVASAAEIAGEWVRRDFWSAAEAVRCPTLLLEAEESIVPDGQGAETAARIPGAERTVLPGTGHLAHAHERAFLDALVPFLEQVVAAP
ncbi:alpha/beta fold hydrolase [Pseudonocardia oroxyli]|uniref:Pimeloyl-ACP methyl ester carboxylesterase n=1 Tax=Pseudonocardia oroxyli TaxID=366584 RepID=A0A1G7PDB9_PSEOR|nr:alpha/beta hydrolase [Pseudonocardia oroxyli]SDF84254.1 Pimeloyl-ACP methyl ester carboxylesterase [Pseudonocardia oroxyli]